MDEDFVEVEENVVLPIDPVSLMQTEAFKTMVTKSAEFQLVNAKGRELAKKWENSTETFVIPEAKTLRQRLAERKPEERCFINYIWPSPGNIYIAAQAGSGKTTFMHNLIRSAVDGAHFLGGYPVNPISGKVVLIDLEMTEDMTDLWLLEQEIVDQDRLVVWNFRNSPLTFDVTDEDKRAAWSARLREIGASVVIYDCVTPLLTALGLDENRDLRKIMYAFFNMLNDADVQQGAIVHHAGWNGKSRGDSAAVGIADVNILLDEEHNMHITKSRLSDYPNYLKLDYQRVNRHLTINSEPSETKPTKEAQVSQDLTKLIEFINKLPKNQGLSANQLEKENTGLTQKRLRACIDLGLETGSVINIGTDTRPKYATKEHREETQPSS